MTSVIDTFHISTTYFRNKTRYGDKKIKVRHGDFKNVRDDQEFG